MQNQIYRKIATKEKCIIDLEKLNTLNAEGCPGCGRKFTLGDPVVLACGTWGGGKKLIHENEAVFDSQTMSYYEKKCFHAKKSK